MVKSPISIRSGTKKRLKSGSAGHGGVEAARAPYITSGRGEGAGYRAAIGSLPVGRWRGWDGSVGSMARATANQRRAETMA